MRYLIASASGSFAFTHGFQLIEKDGEGKNRGVPSRVVGRSPRSWAGKGAALLVMAFIASQALMTILVLHR